MPERVLSTTLEIRNFLSTMGIMSYVVSSLYIACLHMQHKRTESVNEGEKCTSTGSDLPFESVELSDSAQTAAMFTFTIRIKLPLT